MELLEWDWIIFLFGIIGSFTVQIYRLRRKRVNEVKYSMEISMHPYYILFMSIIGGILANIVPLPISNLVYLKAFVIGLLYDVIISIVTQLPYRKKLLQELLAIGINSDQQDSETKYFMGHMEITDDKSRKLKLNLRGYLALLLL